MTIFNKIRVGTVFAALLVCICASWFAMGSVSSDVTDNKLLLYSHHHSYYAKKVLLTLEEKRVPYTVRRVDLMRDQQYEPWFIKINPRGEIPVLQDGSTIVTDSKRIIAYLHSGFSQGSYISLLPEDVGPTMLKKVAELRSSIDAIDGNLIQFGLLYHTEFTNTNDRHYPYSLPGVCSALKASVDNMPTKLKSLVEKYPENKEILLAKADRAEITKQLVQSKEEFEKEVDALNFLFSSLEYELESQGSQDGWLTGEKFTQADVSLTILMDRLWRLGASEKFWGKLPYLKRYFERVQKRDAYVAIDAGFIDDVPTFWPFIAVAAGILVLIIAVLCFIPSIVKKYTKVPS